MQGKHKMLAFEIGTEEIPAFDLVKATDQLPLLAKAVFEDFKIPYEDIEAASSPRRLILTAKLADETEALVEEHKGPACTIAYDSEGVPTKAALGFARGKGIDVESLERREVGGTEYVFGVKSIASRPVAALLPDALLRIIESISWPKSCRWGTQSALFSRPVRWLLALFDAEVIPVRYAGLTAGRLTYGHRVLAPGPHTVDNAEQLHSTLLSAYVVPGFAAREAIIRKEVCDIEEEEGLSVKLPEKTLTEVVNLTEYPLAIVGSFDKDFLKVPEEIIVDAMLMHQRYFPLYDNDGALTHHFIIVSNGDPAYRDVIARGNERVVRARLSDAKFFYEEDLKQPLEAYLPRLAKVVFQESLGTMKDKVDRIITVCDRICANAELNDEQTTDALRAACLCKADLVTNAVVEFTSVQGIMGSYYAHASGESDVVATAIADHYRPRFSGDELPRSVVGMAVATADKIDTICGLFAVGQGPTGSSDPFALRRSAIGIISMLFGGLDVALGLIVDASLDSYKALTFDQEAVKAEVVNFFVTRTKVMLRDQGADADVIDAVLATGVSEPAVIVERVQALDAARKDSTETMENLAVAYARANNLRDEQLGTQCDESLMGDAERALFEALVEIESEVDHALSENKYEHALRALAALRAPIDRFFIDVLVMDDDDALRINRLRLLNRFVAVFSHVADFGKMAKSGA